MGPAEEQPAKACYNCTKRRIICDKKQPECGKCLKKGLVCPGYGVRYRFAAGTTTPAAVFKPAEQNDDVGSSRERTRLRWRPVLDKPRASKAPKAQASNVARHADIPDLVGIQQEECELVVSGSSTGGEIGLLSQDAISLNILGFATMPPFMVSHNRQVRMLFDHFEKYIAPVMLTFDDESNGYRHQVLPLAHSDPVVERAVCTAAALHLSERMPELRLPAETGRAAIVSKLTQTAFTGVKLDDSTWTTILLLIVADLITGHKHVTSMWKMLSLFLEARGHPEPQSVLGEFLAAQTHLISYFARAVMDPKVVATTDATGFFPCVDEETLGQGQQSLAIVQNMPASQQLRESTTLYAEIFNKSHQIFLLRHAAGAADDFRAGGLIYEMRDLLDRVQLDAPGGHIVVWPAFVAAAESVTMDDRQFFLCILQCIRVTTGYGNVQKAIDALPVLWAQQGQQGWTSLLPQLGTIVM